MTRQVPQPSAEPDEAESSGHHTAEMVGAGAGIAAALLLIRVLAVAHWDWNVAGHLLDTFDFGSAISVAVGTLFASPALAAIVAAVITPVAVLGVMMAVHHRASLLVALSVTIVCVAMLISLAISTGTWWGLVVAAVLTAALIVVMRLRAAGRLRDGVTWVVRRLGIAVLIGLFALVIGVQDPWMSPEHITMTDGTVRTLYVLKESPNGLHVLVPGGDVEILMVDEVQSREYP